MMQNPLAVFIASVCAFLGLQAASFVLGLNEVSTFLGVSFAVYLFLVIWQAFIFDLHLKTSSIRTIERTLLGGLKNRWAYLWNIHHFLHFQNYLILPGIIYWMTVILIYLNPFDELVKQVWIAASSIALAAAQWYLKTVFLAHKESGAPARQIIFTAKLYASYIAFAAAFGISRYFGPLPADQKPDDYFTLGAPGFAVIAFCATVLLLYQALFQHHFVGFKILKYLFAAGTGLAVLGFALFYYWNVNYYSGALVMAGVYNTVWGIIHHKYIDKNLTRTIVYEYLAVLFVILVMVFSTTNFAERI